jgi:RimJ/RimL family protein N-acetyltransferase
MTGEAVLFDEVYPDLQLVPFALKRGDEAVRKAYLGWLNDMDVVRPIASPALMVPNKGAAFVEESFARFTHSTCRGFFIYYAPDRAFIGTAKLDSISVHTRSAWDGIMIGDKHYFGRGLSSKVYRVLLAYAFGELGLHRVNGGCNEKNVPMVRTFKRLGYTPEGRLRQADCIDGEFSDHLYFGILRDEFFTANRLSLKIKTS